jgi:hypothetical protein
MSDVTNKVMALSKPYLGPAAESFIAKQCKAHLKIEAADLASGHLKDLSSWIFINGANIMDRAKALELSKKVAAL